MVREFELPDVGEGLTEAEIVEWHVEVGDTVEEDQVVAEVETDKAVVEVPAPVNGTVREILAEPGEMVTVGEVIITFDVEGEAADEAEPEAETDSETATPADAEEPGDERQPAAKGGRVFAAPSARRLARELDVDIERVQGSGPGGRVTEADVRAAAERTTGPHETSEAVEESDGALGEQAAREEGEVTSAVRRAGEGGVESKLGRETEPPERGRTLATPATRKLARELGVDLDRIPARPGRRAPKRGLRRRRRPRRKPRPSASRPSPTGASGAPSGSRWRSRRSPRLTSPTTTRWT